MRIRERPWGQRGPHGSFGPVCWQLFWYMVLVTVTTLTKFRQCGCRFRSRRGGRSAGSESVCPVSSWTARLNSWLRYPASAEGPHPDFVGYQRIVEWVTWKLRVVPGA